MAKQIFPDMTQAMQESPPGSSPDSPAYPQQTQINALNSPIIGSGSQNNFNYTFNINTTSSVHIYGTADDIPVQQKPKPEVEQGRMGKLKSVQFTTNNQTWQRETMGSPRQAFEWKEMTKIKTFGEQQKAFIYVDEVAAFSTNEIVALDRVHKKTATFSPASKGIFSQELQIDLANPSHISVNNNDNLIVLDCLKVKIFNTNYQTCLHKFKPGRDSHTCSTPSCLAVDDSNQIAVGYQDAEEISLHNPSGLFKRRISAPEIGERLTTYKGRLIYIDRDRKKLVSLDPNKGLEFCKDIQPLAESKAYGLCCDIDGNIYVAMHDGRLLEGEIQRFSPDGEYTGCARRVRCFPQDITFTPFGDLVMAAEEVVKIYPRGLRRQPAIRK